MNEKEEKPPLLVFAPYDDNWPDEIAEEGTRFDVPAGVTVVRLPMGEATS
jgi:hypothetical protein